MNIIIMLVVVVLVAILFGKKENEIADLKVNLINLSLDSLKRNVNTMEKLLTKSLIIEENKKDILTLERLYKETVKEYELLEKENSERINIEIKMAKEIKRLDKIIDKQKGLLDKAQIAIAFSEKKFQDLKNKKNICKRK